MMLGETLVAITAILVVIGLPVGGLVIRFALHPFAKEIAGAIRSQGTERGEGATWEVLDHRLGRIERSLVEQEALTRRMLEVSEFDRQITSPEAGKE